MRHLSSFSAGERIDQGHSTVESPAAAVLLCAERVAGRRDPPLDGVNMRGGKKRRVPLSSGVLAALRAHERSFPSAEITLPWDEPDGKPVTVQLLATGEGGRVYTGARLALSTTRGELAECLGHSDPGFTLRTYTHLVPSSYERTRQAIEGVFSLKAADGLEAA